MVIFSKHNIIFDTPFNKMDLVLCRNVLIYIQPEYQEKVLSSLHYALSLGGLLMLGSSETIGEHNALLEVNRKARLYRNTQTSSSMGARNAVVPFRSLNASVSSWKRSSKTMSSQLFEQMNELLADEYDLVSILIDETFSILHVTGEFRKYIELPERGFSSNLLDILPKHFSTIVRTAVYKSRREKERIRYKNVQVGAEQEQSVDMLVIPFAINRDFNTQFLVSFLPTEPKKYSTAKAESPHQNQRVAELEAELEDSRLSLQTTIDDMEMSNEELQVTNEELLATNEELQSTNEELQSVNEELHTSNTEHQLKLDQLRQLRTEMDNLLRSTDIGTLFLDQYMSIRRITPAIKKQFNLEEQDLGRPLAHFTSAFGEEANNNILSHAQEVFRQGSSIKYELKANDHLWYLIQIDPYYNSEKIIDGVVLSFVDITERKKVELALRYSEERLTKAQYMAQIGDFTWDIETGEVSWSLGLYRVMGYDPDETIDVTEIMDKIHQTEDKDEIDTWLNTCVEAKDGKLTPLEYRIRRKNGEFIYVRTEGEIEYREGSSPIVVGSVQDITERKLTEIKLRQSETKLRTIFEAIPATVTLLSNDGTVLYVNRLVDGIDKDEYIGSKVWNWLPEELGAQLKEQIDIVNQSGQSVYFDNDFTDPTGVTHHYYHVMSPVLDNDLAMGVAVISQEVTDLKAMEKELRHQRDRLAYKNEELKQFAYVAAHDLQEPLRTVSSFATLLDQRHKDQLDPKGLEILSFITSASQRMGKLIKGLLDYSLLGRKRELSTVDCQSLIQEIKDDLSLRLEEEQGVLKAEGLPTIEGSKTELRLLFQNLISNAIKFRKQGIPPVIQITATQEGEAWTFLVRDNGIGIEEDHTERIFLIFQRLHTAEEYEGVGIGLAHAKKIVSLHGGTIWAESKVGEGTSFYFTLPTKAKREEEH